MPTWVFSRPSGSFVGQADTDLATVSVPLQDAPGDFGTPTAVSIAATTGAVYVTGWDNDSYGVECRIMSGATVLAAADAGGGWVPVQGLSGDWTTAKQFPAITFAYVNTAATSGDWDAAEIEYRQLYSKTQKADNGYVIVAGGVDDISVTYVGAPATGNLSVTFGDVSLASATQVAQDGTAAITLGDLTATIRGTIGTGGTGAITLGAATLSSTGFVLNPGPATGDLNVTLGALTLSSTGLGDRTATAAITLGDLAMSSRTEVGGGTAVALIDDEQIAAAFGGGGGGDTQTMEGTAGEALSVGDLCYIGSNGKFFQAGASTETTGRGMLTVATQTLALDEVGDFLLDGFRNETGLTTGAVLYLSTTAGGVTHTPPTGSGEIVRVIGYATTTTQYYFHPDKTWLKVA